MPSENAPECLEFAPGIELELPWELRRGLLWGLLWESS